MIRIFKINLLKTGDERINPKSNGYFHLLVTATANVTIQYGTITISFSLCLIKWRKFFDGYR